MNYKKVIKGLKERNDKLKEQYILRDIRCIHLEYENEMLKSDFEAQHELTKNYAEENKRLKDNWNKLKEWVNKHYDYYMNEEDYIGGRLCFTDMKNKMQELEGGEEIER